MAVYKLKKPTPYAFVLDELESIYTATKPMFGCLAIYADEKIIFILRKKEDHVRDNGVWIATTPEHHASLQKEFPSMRSLFIFGPGPTAWQNLPEDAPDFEEAVLRACELARRRDPRIGKVPKPRKPRKTKRSKKTR